MRVLYFIGSYGPEVMGNASHEQTILALRRRGHDVDVLTQVTQPGKPLYMRAVHSGVSVFSVNLAARTGRTGGLLRKAAGQLLKYEYIPTLISAYRRQLRAHRYDLVHVEGAYPFGFVVALAGGSTPYMANVQGADVIDLPEADYGYRRFKLPRVAVRYALGRASLVRSISPLLTEYLVKEKLARPGQVVTVMRSIEESAFPPPDRSLDDFRAESRDALTRRYGIGLRRPVVMSLSRLHPFKGIEYLVDALPIVAREMRKRGAEPPWLLICGPSRSTESFGDYREFLSKRAERAGVAGHVIFTGQVPHEEVRYHLAGADVLVCPSIIEAQNKVVPEACAVGTPSVVTETTGITSYLAPMDACMSVPPRSAEAIAQSILRLLGEPDLYARLSRRAMEAAETMRVEALVPQLEAAWARCVKRET
jgi:glycosyltransferase involved in cell wall biosynthesis